MLCTREFRSAWTSAGEGSRHIKTPCAFSAIASTAALPLIVLGPRPAYTAATRNKMVLQYNSKITLAASTAALLGMSPGQEYTDSTLLAVLAVLFCTNVDCCI